MKSTLHTHDRTGVIHMEAAKPFRYTLGDFFAVWGVRFGGGTLGSLEDSGSDRVWVYVDGKRITDPARHVLANNDNIVVAYGTKDSFPHTVGDYWLKQVEKGGKALPCAAATPTAPAKPCLAPKRSRHSGWAHPSAPRPRFAAPVSRRRSPRSGRCSARCARPRSERSPGCA